MTLKPGMTLDQVIASNVTRLREARNWTVTALARELSVTRHDVLSYEGRRPDRPQRPFRWTELVELSYIFGARMYELVLPADSDMTVDIGGTALVSLPLEELAFWLESLEDAPTDWAGRGPRSKELGLALFGAPGDKLLEEANLELFHGHVLCGCAEARPDHR